MRAGTDGQVHVGRWNAQLLEEHVGHAYVVMLAGVDEGLLDMRALLEGGEDGRDLHEVRAGSDDVE